MLNVISILGVWTSQMKVFMTKMQHSSNYVKYILHNRAALLTHI